MKMKAKGMKKGGASKVPAKKITMKKTVFDVTAIPEAKRKKIEKMLRSVTGAAMTKEELEAAMKNIGSGIAKDVDSSLSQEDSKKLRDRMKKAQTMKKGGAMKTKGMKKGGAMKSKGYAKGGAMKTKGMAKGGMMKAKGMAKGGAMKTKGGNKGGVKRNMRPPSSKKSGLYGK